MLDFGPVEDKMQGIIKVIGVGGGGCNAVRNMNDEKIPGVTFAVCNTDSKSLAPSPVPTKILLGEGLGAGGKPEIGRSEAEKNTLTSTMMSVRASRDRSRHSTAGIRLQSLPDVPGEEENSGKQDTRTG